MAAIATPANIRRTVNRTRGSLIAYPPGSTSFKPHPTTLILPRGAGNAITFTPGQLIRDWQAFSLRINGHPVQEVDLAHLSPCRYEHINPYGKYAFDVSEDLGMAELHLLRPGRSPAWRRFLSICYGKAAYGDFGGAFISQ